MPSDALDGGQQKRVDSMSTNTGHSRVNTWTRQEPGWYTHPSLGGICQEADGWWYWYPLIGGSPVKAGKTLKEVIEMAEGEKS